MSTSESYSVPALLRAIEELNKRADSLPFGVSSVVAKACGEILARAAELTASSASGRQEGEGDVQGWRLIESAPGGVRILAYWPSDHSIETAEWNRKWYKDVDDMPTHWQPLPEPPHED